MTLTIKGLSSYLFYLLPFPFVIQYCLHKVWILVLFFLLTNLFVFKLPVWMITSNNYIFLHISLRVITSSTINIFSIYSHILAFITNISYHFSWFLFLLTSFTVHIYLCICIYLILISVSAYNIGKWCFYNGIHFCLNSLLCPCVLIYFYCKLHFFPKDPVATLQNGELSHLNFFSFIFLNYFLGIGPHLCAQGWFLDLHRQVIPDSAGDHMGCQNRTQVSHLQSKCHTHGAITPAPIFFKKI